MRRQSAGPGPAPRARKSQPLPAAVAAGAGYARKPAVGFQRPRPARDRCRRLGRLILRRLEPGVQVARQKRLAEGREQVAVNPLRIAEPDLDLGRMDVDVNLLGRNLQVEERDRIPPDHQQPAVGLAQGVAQRPIADIAAAQEEELALVASTGFATGGRHSPRGTGCRAGLPPRAATRPARGRRRWRSARAFQ